MSVDIKVFSVDEKRYFSAFRVLRLWLYPVTRINKRVIYLLASVIQVISNQ